MSQIMKAGVFVSKSADRFLEILINRQVDQMISDLICEHQACRIAPCVSGKRALFLLLPQLRFKKTEDIWGDSNHPSSAVLGGGEHIITAYLLGFRELLVDVQCTAFKVYAIPGQAQDLPLAQPGEKGRQVKVFIPMAPDSVDKLPNVVLLKWGDFFFVYFR